MRWDDLFADLEGQFTASRRAELEADIAEQTRAEVGQLRFAGRLRAQLGAVVTLDVQGVGELVGTLSRTGGDFALLEPTGSGAREVVVALDAITAAIGLPVTARAEAGTSAVARRLPMRAALRALAAERAYVSVHRRSGRRDGGTLARVGADFVDLAVHPPDDVPRPGQVRSTLTIALPAVAAVARQSTAW